MVSVSRRVAARKLGVGIGKTQLFTGLFAAELHIQNKKETLQLPQGFL